MAATPCISCRRRLLTWSGGNGSSTSRRLLSTYLHINGFSRNSSRADAHAYLDALLNKRGGGGGGGGGSDGLRHMSRLWPVVDTKMMLPTGNWVLEFGDDSDAAAREEAVGRILKGNKRTVGSKVVTVAQMNENSAKERIGKCSVQVATWGVPLEGGSSGSRNAKREGGGGGGGGASSSEGASSSSSSSAADPVAVALEAPLMRLLNIPKGYSVAELEHLLRDFDVDLVGRIVTPAVQHPYVARFADEAEAHRAVRELSGTYLGSHVGWIRMAMYK